MPYPLLKKLFSSALIDSAPQSIAVAAEELPVAPPTAQDRLCAKYDAARMIRQMRQRSGLSEAQFAARLGMQLKDVLMAEIGEADYQHTMDVRDRVQSILGYAQDDPDIQPQAERSAATQLAALIARQPD